MSTTSDRRVRGKRTRVVSKASEMVAKNGLTYSQRFLAFTEFTSAYHVYLKERGGVVLSAETRLSIAHCARDALIQCKGCKSLPKETCVMAGTDVYTLISERLEHYESAMLKHSSPSAHHTITVLVHALINHQSILDEQWYHRTIEALDTSPLIPSSFVGERRSFYVLALFSEIVHVTTLSHSLNSFFLSTGHEIPALPDHVGSPSEPSFFDWTKILRTKTTNLRLDKTVAWAPFIVSADVKRDSSEFAKLPLSALDKRILFDSMDAKFPWSCVSFAPEDLVWLRRWFSVSYLHSMDDFLFPFFPLDPSFRCSDSFSRYLVEFTAEQVSKVHRCDF